MNRRLIPIAWLLALLCAVSVACADWSLTDQGLDLGTASVHWPQLTGMEAEEDQQRLNAILRERSGVETWTARMAAVMNADPPLRVSWRGILSRDGGLVSCVLRCEGPLETERFRSEWRTINLDLRTTEEIPMRLLFRDPVEAAARIEDYLEEEIQPEMSAHLANCALTPLPEDYVVGPEGLTLCYPLERLSTLSDRAGAVTLSWGEILDLLDLDVGSAADRFGVTGWIGEAGADLLDDLAAGSLPGLPCALSDSVETLVGEYRLLCDPDGFEGGRYVQLEDSRFRQVFLMTDDLSEKRFDGSVVSGIRCDRFGFGGLFTGRTTRGEAEARLGEPYAAVALDADAAEAMRLPEGTSVYYRCGEYRLRLHFDSGDTLTSLFLLP